MTKPQSNVAQAGGRGRSFSFSIPAGGAGAAAGSFMLPPLIHPALNDALGVWPPPQSGRDKIVGVIAQGMVEPSGYTHYFGAVPDLGLARRAAAAAIEAEGFASARTSLDSAANRFTIFRLYARMVFTRLDEFGTTYTTDPDAAFAALGLGAAWRERKSSSASSATAPPLLPPPPAAPASEAAGASSSSPATALSPAAAPSDK